MAILSSPLQYVTSTPPTTRYFTLATIAFTALYFVLRNPYNGQNSTPYLTLLPGSSLFFPWTFFTAGLVETSILEVRLRVVFE